MPEPTLHVQPLPKSNKTIKCSRGSACDGRPAKWVFPQTAHLDNGPFYSCSVHVPRFLEIVLNYLLSDPAADHETP